MAQTSVAATRNLPTNYAFVNYTDLNSMHDTSTYTQIRKHAMRQVGAAKKRPRGRNRTTIELFWVPTAPKTRHFTQNDESKHECQSCDEKTVVRAGRVADDRAFYDAFIRSLSYEMDPFGTASVTLDGPARELLQYFMYYASRYPNTWTYSSSPLLPNSPSEHKQSINRTLGAALQDVLLGHCLLATAASRVSYTDGAIKLQIQERELSLTQTSLRLLRDRLEASADAGSHEIQILIASMLHLGSAAFYKGDVPTAALHIKAATSLAERIGGVHAITDPYVRGRIISFDDLISCLEMRPCFLDDAYDPVDPSTPISGTDMVYVEDESTASGLLAVISSMLPSSLQDLVLQIIQHQATTLQITQSPDQSTFQALASRQWLALRLLAIRNRLLALELNDARTHILRIVLIMWTLLPSVDMQEATIAHALAPKLKHLLEQQQTLEWTDHEDIHLWCLLMGYLCSQEGSRLQVWFAGEVRRSLLSKLLDSWKDIGLVTALTAFQKRYLYHEAVQAPATDRLAEWLLRA